ncbi:MAG: hypothetical protein J6M18_03675 [Actinomycetaceae bacterium]|nr:hypothetical protein [Actinomycetaceae bacterium]
MYLAQPAHAYTEPQAGRYTWLKNLLSHKLFFFYLAFALWMVYRILSVSLYDVYLFTFGEIPIRLGIFVLLALTEIRMQQNRKTIWAIAFLIFIFWIGRHTGSLILVDYVLLFFVGRHANFKKIALIAFVTTIFTLSFVVITSQFGVVIDYLWQRDPGMYVRHGLGFKYPIYPAQFFLSIVLLYMYLAREQAKYSVIALLMLVNFGMYTLTDARTSFILVTGALVVILLFKFRVIISAYTPFLQLLSAAFVWPIFALISYMMAAIYNPHVAWHKALNSALSNRLAQTKATLEEAGIPLFGQQLQIVGNGINSDGTSPKDAAGDYSTNYVDNSFMQILIYNGWVFAVVMLALLFYVGYRSARNNMAYVSVILFFIAVRSLIDEQLLSLMFTPFLFLLTTFDTAIYEEKRQPYGKLQGNYYLNRYIHGPAGCVKKEETI